MNRLFKFIGVLLVIGLLGFAYKAQITRAAMTIDYRVVLEYSLNDTSVANFVVNHDCAASAGDFQICPAAGVALRMNQPNVIGQVYLYVNGDPSFASFTGKLPYEITSTDTMANVQRKLGNPKIPQMPVLGWEPRLPDIGNTPDHIHYWATYKDFRLTVVYNTPAGNDLEAGIYMIIVDAEPVMPNFGRTISL